MDIYIASSFKNIHVVTLLTEKLKEFGHNILDWTLLSTPPQGLSERERREWVNSDPGREVFCFCAEACASADLVIYVGTSGQDCGVELGIAFNSGVPIVGLRGLYEEPGLMMNGVVKQWFTFTPDLLGWIDSAQTAEDAEPFFNQENLPR